MLTPMDSGKEIHSLKCTCTSAPEVLASTLYCVLGVGIKYTVQGARGGEGALDVAQFKVVPGRRLEPSLLSQSKQCVSIVVMLCVLALHSVSLIK